MNRHGWPGPACLIAGCLLTLNLCSLGCRGGGPTTDASHALPLAAVRPPDLAHAVPPTPAEQSVAEPVKLASYEPTDDELPSPPDDELQPVSPPELLSASAPLELNEVIVSVQQSYPLLRSALLERQVAGGKELSAWGEFDLGVKAFGIETPQGYYQNYRHAILLEQPVFSGGYVYGGYKIGDGDIQPWYGERETNEGGEFATGLGIPLLSNRAIDKRREAVFTAGLARQAVEPAIQAQLLEFVRVSSQVYWSWVAAGQVVEAQRELLKLAQARVTQIEERVKVGDLGRISLINNDQLIAARETKLIEAQRKLQESAIKLSLFLRSPAGQPIVPAETRLPESFPAHSVPDPEQLRADIDRAIAARPELVELRLVADQVRVELAQAENMMLPVVDARLQASKDVGAAASSKGDKTPFELEVGLYGEVPLQRREARGKIETARGKLAQIEAKRQFVVDKVTAAVQDAMSALEAASERIERASTNLRLARETLVLGREQFNAGDIDLVSLNIYEQAVTDGQLLLIAAEADYFDAQADYRAALSLAPLPPQE